MRWRSAAFAVALILWLSSLGAPARAGLFIPIFNPKDDVHHGASIVGQCIIQDSQLPCQNVTIFLTDLDGHVYSEAQTQSNGGFSFRAYPDVKYRVRISSEIYEMAVENDAPLKRGDQTTIYLLPLRGPAQVQTKKGSR